METVTLPHYCCIHEKIDADRLKSTNFDKFKMENHVVQAMLKPATLKNQCLYPWNSLVEVLSSVS